MNNIQTAIAEIKDHTEHNLKTKLSAETCEIVVQACKKQVTKKPLERHYEDIGDTPYIKTCCPNGCRVQLSKYDFYCNKCGQKIDWSGEDE